MKCTRCKPILKKNGMPQNDVECLRPETRFDGTHRRVQCKRCGHKFDTLEVAVESFAKIELQHYEDRTRKLLAEIRELVRSVAPARDR